MTDSRSSFSSLLARGYDACLHFADACAARPRALLFVAAPLITLLVLATGWFVLQEFPNSGDEYAYLYQAETLAQGRLWNPAPPQPDSFAFNYIVHERGRAYSSFPVGWPLMLALAPVASLPAWLVNPILGTISLWLIVRLGTRLHNVRVGILAAAIVAVSGFFLFNAASYFSHTFCSVLLLGAAVLAAREDRVRWWIPMAIGFLLGWAVLARYFTAVVAAIPVIVLMLRDRTPMVRTLTLCALGGLPWITVLAFYNLSLNGSPWELTTLPSTMGLWFAPKFLGRGADILSTQMLRLVLWTPPLLLFVYIYALARAPRTVRRGLIDWMPVLMAAALYCYTERGGNQYGPRFYYETFPFLVVFTAAAVFKERAFADKSPADRRVCGMLLASLAVMPLSFLAHAFIEQRVIAERLDPYKLVAAAGLAEAIVLIRGRVGTARSMGPRDFTRNGIEHDDAVLYGLDMDEAANCRLLDVYPRRTLYRYTWDAAGRRGALEPIVCP